MVEINPKEISEKAIIAVRELTRPAMVSRINRRIRSGEIKIENPEQPVDFKAEDML